MITVITTAEDYYVADNLNQIASLIEENGILDKVYEGEETSTKIEEVGIGTTLCREVTADTLAELYKGMSDTEKAKFNEVINR